MRPATWKHCRCFLLIQRRGGGAAHLAPVGSDHEPEDDSHDGATCSSQVTDPLWYNMRRMQIRCFDHKLRRINIENYRGQQLERLLAEFLLSKAAALDKFSVTVTAQHSRHRIACELKSWRSNRHTRVADKVIGILFPRKQYFERYIRLSGMLNKYHELPPILLKMLIYAEFHAIKCTS